MQNICFQTDFYFTCYTRANRYEFPIKKSFPPKGTLSSRFKRIIFAKQIIVKFLCCFFNWLISPFNQNLSSYLALPINYLLFQYQLRHFNKNIKYKRWKLIRLQQLNPHVSLTMTHEKLDEFWMMRAIPIYKLLFHIYLALCMVQHTSEPIFYYLSILYIVACMVDV